MSMELLRALAGHSDPAISTRAQMVLQATGAHETGHITTQEYQELCRDFARMDVLDRQCADLTVKTAIVTAIHSVAQLS